MWQAVVKSSRGERLTDAKLATRRRLLGEYAPDGGLVGAGFDENHDGRIDVYKTRTAG
jgi:hypothetical protein